MDGVQHSQGYSHFEEAVYFFTILLINKVKELASDALAVLTQSNQELLHQRKWYYMAGNKQTSKEESHSIYNF